MFGFAAKTEDTTDRVKQAANKATFENSRHGLFRISKDAKASIKKRKTPSKPGEPPTTRGRGGHNLRGAIFVAADKEFGIAGPRASVVGEAGEAHEFGGEYRGDQFDERSFMGPALEANMDRFASDWANSIGE